jgi:hypothetical protein
MLIFSKLNLSLRRSSVRRKGFSKPFSEQEIDWIIWWQDFTNISGCVQVVQKNFPLCRVHPGYAVCKQPGCAGFDGVNYGRWRRSRRQQMARLASGQGEPGSDTTIHPS